MIFSLPTFSLVLRVAFLSTVVCGVVFATLDLTEAYLDFRALSRNRIANGRRTISISELTTSAVHVAKLLILTALGVSVLVYPYPAQGSRQITNGIGILVVVVFMVVDVTCSYRSRKIVAQHLKQRVRDESSLKGEYPQ